MDRSIPLAAQSILKFIYTHESAVNYDCVSNNVQRKLPKKITAMTVDEIIAEGPTWHTKYGALSSAAGAGQIITKTLIKLKQTMNLKGTEKFSPDLQDRLCMQLLRFRGYDQFMAGNMSVSAFAKALAQEWASMPVLASTKGSKGTTIPRGASYYAGDGLNASAQNSANEFERILKAANSPQAPAQGLLDTLVVAQAQPASINMKPASTPIAKATQLGVAVAGGAAAIGSAAGGGAKDAAETVTTYQPIIDLAAQIGHYGPAVAGGIVAAVVSVVIGRKIWTSLGK